MTQSIVRTRRAHEPKLPSIHSGWTELRIYVYDNAMEVPEDQQVVV